MRKVLLILLLFLLAGCSTDYGNLERLPLVQPPKEIQVSKKMLYNLSTEINEDVIRGDYHSRYQGVIRYEFHTGPILKGAVKYFVYPFFDQGSKENIHLKIRTSNIEGKEVSGGSTVKVTIDTTIYKDNLILYSFSSEGFSTGEFRILVNYPDSMRYPARDAIVEAAKKIPEEVSNVLSNPEGAIAKVEEKIKANPNSYLDYLSLAHLSFLAKRYHDALAAAKRAAELNPKGGAAYVFLGDIQKTLKNYTQAVENYKKAIALARNHYAWYIRLSEIYDLQENYTEMVNLWQKVVSANPTVPIHYAGLASAYTKVGKYNDAIASLNKVIDIRTITGIGTNISIEENYPVVEGVDESGPAKRGGIEVGDKIVKINDQSIKDWDINKVVQNIRGAEGTQVTLTIERKGKEFEKIITREKMMQKSAAYPLGLRSQVYAAMGNHDQSFKDAEMAYSLDPNDRDAKTAISLAYIQKGNPDEAIKILSGSEGDFDKLLISLAYAKKGEFERASAVYRDLPEDYLGSKSVFRQDFKKMVLQSMKPYIEGKRKQVETLEAKAQYKEALKGYSDLIRFLDEKQTKKLRAHIARLLKEKPYLLELPEEARKFALRAEEYTKEGKFEESVNEYKKALSIAPFFPELYKAIALNYGGMKEYKKAIENMNIYLELYSDAPDARAAKDEIYRWEAKMEKEGK